MWLSRNDILRLAPPSLQKELRGEDSVEEMTPKANGSITVEIVEATDRRPERVALGFYNVDYHISIEQAVSLANDILEKTGYAAKGSR